jgi:hypothetical protein
MPGTWTPLVHQPTFSASTMLLLTDGSVVCQEAGGINWWRLTPDKSGSYVSGSWNPLAPMHNTRLYYASAVLKDGRVIASGGEYSDAGSETNATETYDPVLDAWTSIAPPAGWSRIGDAASSVLPDGTLLLGNLDDTRTALFDPVSGAWHPGPDKEDQSSEESWVLLPDQTVLTVECMGHPKSEKYVAPANAWTTAGALPVELVEASSIEIGPGVLLPDGRAFFVGATGHTALYTPAPIASQPGTWAAGPDLPTDASGMQLGAKDAPGCLLPNGKVLCAVGPVDGQGGSFLSPTYFFEFDGTSLARVPDPPNASGVPYAGRMLLLPTGQALFAAGTPAIHAYTPDGSPDPAWAPGLTAWPTTIRRLGTYTLQGRQLNGLSQAVGYGDDAGAATNYPLVRIRYLATGHVRYLRTFDHSSMGVATGTALHTTNFSVPFDVELGLAELCLIANGISSPCVLVDVLPFRIPFPVEKGLVNWLIGSLADGPLWVLGPHGPIPVDPWGPKIAREAEAARAQVIQGVERLRQLGDRLHAKRFDASRQVAPAVDEEAEAGQKTDAAGRGGTARRRPRGATSKRNGARR